MAGIFLTLAVNLGGVLWIAGGIEEKTKSNADKIEKLENVQNERSESIYVSVAKIDNLEKRLDRIETIVIKIWERVK
jgi:hypothetical protein